MLDYLSYFNYLITKLDITNINNLQLISIGLLILMATIGFILVITNASGNNTIIRNIIQIVELILMLLSVVLVYPSQIWVKKFRHTLSKKR